MEDPGIVFERGSGLRKAARVCSGSSPKYAVRERVSAGDVFVCGSAERPSNRSEATLTMLYLLRTVSESHTN